MKMVLEPRLHQLAPFSSIEKEKAPVSFRLLWHLPSGTSLLPKLDVE